MIWSALYSSFKCRSGWLMRSFISAAWPSRKALLDSAPLWDRSRLMEMKAWAQALARSAASRGSREVALMDRTLEVFTLVTLIRRFRSVTVISWSVKPPYSGREASPKPLDTAEATVWDWQIST